jgi:hypothetical protein
MARFGKIDVEAALSRAASSFVRTVSRVRRDEQQGVSAEILHDHERGAGDAVPPA